MGATEINEKATLAALVTEGNTHDTQTHADNELLSLPFQRIYFGRGKAPRKNRKEYTLIRN
jgi:hypothetical protein